VADVPSGFSVNPPEELKVKERHENYGG
jgi:hypothetical protein